MKVHLFKKQQYGGWSFDSTQEIPDNTLVAKMHHEISGLEVGDLVLLSVSWHQYEGAGIWRGVHPQTPGYEQLNHLKDTKDSR
jgi:hypothetical protein